MDAKTVSKVPHEQGHNEAQMLAVGRCPGWPDLWHLNYSIRIRIGIPKDKDVLPVVYDSTYM